MMKKDSQIYTLIMIIAFLSVLQLLRIGINHFLYSIIPNGYVTGHIPNTIFMGINSVIFIYIFYIKERNAFFPIRDKTKNKIIFWFISALSFFLIFSSLIFDYSIASIYLLFHGSIIIPIFEEILFRGMIWKRLEKVSINSWGIWIIITLIFAVWHIGYADSIIWRIGEQNIFFIMAMKVLTGLIVGIPTGLARKKSGTIYYSILIHAVWNVFAG